MKPKSENCRTLSCDLCVVGGGLAGTFAAISAARHGASVVLLQDRPMLGGNASSEIRMWVRGATGPFDRESGLISEYEEAIIHGNPDLSPCVSDAILYDMATREKNLTLLLNTTCVDAECDGKRIRSVTAWQLTTYTWITVRAALFADCSGDSILAPLTGAEYRHGREAKAEYGESLAQETADSRTMGMSLILAARETDHAVPFTPPPFANVYETDEAFDMDAGESLHAQIRDHRVGTSGCNLWWVELGGDLDTVADADRIREELLPCIYGVWDHVKNRGDHGMENWELEWVGCLPGKRESRRYVGPYVMTEQDVLSGGHFADEIAYGGWALDDHNPYGMKRNGASNTASHMIPVKEIYGIPYRTLYSRNIENLTFAGRNISVTHVCLSSTRVMATCALLGQACGTAAAVAVRHGCLPAEVSASYIGEVQEMLLTDGVFLPHIPNRVGDTVRAARLNRTDAEREILLNGWERPRTAADENSIPWRTGERLTLEWDEPQDLGDLRLRFDPDYSRASISVNRKMRVFCMKLHTGLDFRPVRVAATLPRELAVYADGEEVARVRENFHALVRLPVRRRAKRVSVELVGTHGNEEIRLFAVDLINEKGEKL